MNLEVIFDIDWLPIWYNLWHLIVAYALAIPIGLDREQSQRHFGLRTFPLVAVVSCGFMLVGMSVIDSTDGEARVFQGIITGKDNSVGECILKNVWRAGIRNLPRAEIIRTAGRHPPRAGHLVSGRCNYRFAPPRFTRFTPFLW